MKECFLSSLLIVLLLWLGPLHASAEKMYYVHLCSGSIEAFPSDLFLTPETQADGSLDVVSKNGYTFSFSPYEYREWNTDVPSFPYFTSFKFNNKFNPALHQDVEAEGLTDEKGQPVNRTDTLHLALNAIGKRLTPSFKTSDPSAQVYAEDRIVKSKISRFRFDHDIVFTVFYPGYVLWTADQKGVLRSSPLGHTYLVHVDWLTDDPYKVPRMDINIEGGKTVTSKDVYLKASFSIHGYGVYEDLAACDVWIKGRGNTSWGWPKKPYRLKFDEKIKPFGLTGGRNWVLLSNYLTGSLFTGALAFKTGQLVESAACNHAIPVELYVNGKYQGSYVFTEKVGFGNNSLDADDSTDCLLELSREYDEPYRFRSVPYNLPVNIKEPDLSAWTADARDERKWRINQDFNRLATAISRQSDEVPELMDIDACARFLLVNDLTNNVEINHPKSTFLYKEDVTGGDTKYIFGPVWDFDWAYGFARTNTYFDTDQQSAWLRQLDGSVGDVFFGDLMNIGVVKRYYYKVWSDFIRNGCVDELKEFVQDYYDFARVSFQHDAELWKQHVSYPDLVKKAQNWLDRRAVYIFDHLTVYDLTEFEDRREGDVNKDGEVTVTDAVMVFDYLLGGYVSGMDLTLADVNYDGQIDLGDVVCIVRRIVEKECSAPSARPYGYHNLSAQLMAQPFEVGIGEQCDIPLQLIANSTECDAYCALQCDVHIPEGMNLDKVCLAREVSGYSITSHTYKNVTRVVLMPTETDVRPLQDFSSILEVSVTAEKAIDPASQQVHINAIRLTTEENDEELLHAVSIAFSETTGIETPSEKCLSVTSGQSIIVTAIEEQDVSILSVDGKHVKTYHVLPGRSSIDLPTGVYVVAGQKAVVY